MGLPAIVSDINGCNEIIVPGKNGEIIPPRDENALYDKMREWIVNPEKVALMTNNAREFVKECFDQNLVWNELLKVYKNLLN